MLTIKHVESNGRERLFTSISIERTAQGDLVILGTEEVIQSGKAYVMNDFGKTVAVYDLNKNKAGAAK